jgi:hypothetical protein
MIYLKKLSGDYLAIEADTSLTVEQILLQIAHPYALLFGEDGELGRDVIVPNESELSVLFQEYHLYFLWKGGENTVWPGKKDVVYCIDCSTMKSCNLESITSQDTVAADLLSFGEISSLTGELYGMTPIDIDFPSLQDVLLCGCDSDEKLTLLEYLSQCPHGNRDLHLYTLERLFRRKVTSPQKLTPKEWKSRITV